MSQQLSSGCRRVWTAIKRGPWQLLAGGRAALLNPVATLRGNAELGDAFTRLETSRDRLRAVSAEVESRFLAVTSVLETLPGASEEMVKQSERLLSLASGREHGTSAFQAAFDLLKRPLDFIDQCQERSQQLTTRLEQATTQIDRMLGYEATLQRTVAPLKFIQTNFKVESAGLSHSVQQMFLALTEDIERLHQQVSETFGAKFEILRSARKTIHAVILQLQASAKTRNAAAHERKQAIQKALSDLQADLKRNEERDIRLTTVSKSINQQVGRMVVSLQAQDMVSQKVAHVLEAVQLMQQRFGGAREGGDKAALTTAMAYCRDASHVQSAQLEAISRDLVTAAGEITGAVGAIRQQIAALDEDSLCLKEFDKVTVGVDGLVQVLLDAMSDVRGMVAGAVSSAEESYAAIRPIGSLTTNVTDTMRQLSAQIRLIALNAQVQAAHVGSGTGLEVLAAGTANIALETTEISENVARELDALTAHLVEHVNAFEELHRHGSAQRDELDGGRPTQESALHSFRDQTLAVLSRVGEAVDSIGRLADAMGEKVDFQTVIDVHIHGSREVLGQIAAASARWLESRGLSSVLPLAAGELARSYTMASEREVHDAILLGRDQASPATAGATGTGPSAEPELFADFSEPQNTPAGPVVADVVPPGLPKPVTSPAVPASPARDFGDNVDLF